MNSSHKKYFEYLKKRSRLGLWYRNHWLYPHICHYLNGHVLDVGCGIGDFLKFRKNTIGVDVNPENIGFCQKMGLYASLIESDHLPFETASFDGIILDNVLEHIQTPEPLLREVHRIIKPFGTFIIGVPGVKGYSKDADHKIFYDKSRLEAIVSPIGFKSQCSFCAPFKSALLDRYLPQYCLYLIFTRD